MKYRWKCVDCGVAERHVSQSANPYLVGFEIYSEHGARSPGCTNLALEIIECDAETFIRSESFQSEVRRIKRIGGFVEVHKNTIALYRGVVPQVTIDMFADRLRRLDQSKLLDIVVSIKNRP